jgi:hypothetical protein
MVQKCALSLSVVTPSGSIGHVKGGLWQMFVIPNIGLLHHSIIYGSAGLKNLALPNDTNKGLL